MRLEGWRVRWVRLVSGTVLTAVCALSVHAAAVQLFHLPGLVGYPTGGPLVFLTQTAMAGAAIILWRVATPNIVGLPGMARCLLLFVLLAMLLQKLIRLPLMNAVVTTAWSFSFLADLPALVPLLVLACLVVWVTPLLPRPWQIILAAPAVAALAFPIGGMLAVWVSRPLLAAAAGMNHGAVYTMPYGLHVLAPAYATALEPAAATVALAALVWNGLRGATWTRIGCFAALVMVLDLHLFQPLVVLAGAGNDRGAALEGVGQSWLATLVQTVLGAATWAVSASKSDPSDRHFHRLDGGGLPVPGEAGPRTSAR